MKTGQIPKRSSPIYIKSKRKNQNAYCLSLTRVGANLWSKSTKTADVWNDKFISGYTHEDTDSISSERPSPHPAMQRIKVTISGVTKHLRELKPHKASGPD